MALGGSQQTGVTARAGSGTHRAPGSEEDSLNPGSEEEERPQACPSPMSLSTPRDVSGTSGMQTVLANYSSYLFDTDSMDWIAAAEATLGTTKEIKRQRLLRSDTSREELPSPAHQKQKTVSRKKRQEKSRYRQRLLPESPGCQYTVREKLVFK